MSKRKIKPVVYDPCSPFYLYHGDCFDLLKAIPDGSVDLILSSPPYCMGKEYEKTQNPADFLLQHQLLAPEVLRILKPGGSVCWQIGMHVSEGVVTPLDYLVMQAFTENSGLILRNRIVWTFGHGLHCSTRFSGRHETVLWFTKGEGYTFDLDAVRVKQKYPGKRSYKGTNKGELTGNPLGKNPGDVWDIPNVKGNHLEKTAHPCQFPISLARRLIGALTKKGELVLDPFLGSGTTACAAQLEGRRCVASELNYRYYRLAKARLVRAEKKTLRFREDKPVLIPDPRSAVAQDPFAA